MRYGRFAIVLALAACGSKRNGLEAEIAAKTVEATRAIEEAAPSYERLRKVKQAVDGGMFKACDEAPPADAARCGYGWLTVRTGGEQNENGASITWTNAVAEPSEFASHNLLGKLAGGFPSPKGFPSAIMPDAAPVRDGHAIISAASAFLVLKVEQYKRAERANNEPGDEETKTGRYTPGFARGRIFWIGKDHEPVCTFEFEAQTRGMLTTAPDSFDNALRDSVARSVSAVLDGNALEADLRRPDRNGP
jgi:hypothetical protein